MRRSERTHGDDAQIAALALGQHGIVERSQLREIGLSDDAINRRMRSGRLQTLYPGVYAVGHRVLSKEAHWMAAVLACGPGAVLSHWSAAALWGIRDLRSGPIHTTSPRKSRSRGSIARHYARLPGDEVTVEDGIPVTTVPRTILDLASVSPLSVEPALRQSEYLRLYDSLSLLDLLERYPGHRGTKAIRAALGRVAEAPGETRSTLEEVFLPFLDRHRLPRPNLNVWLTVSGQRFKVDCLWPDQRLIVELDSWEAHGTRSAFREDKARDRKLQRAGYNVTRLLWAQLRDEPEAVAEDLRCLLSRRASRSSS